MIAELFPLWGETGESPPDGFSYSSGDQINEKHFDWLWNGIYTLEDETRQSLEDIDSDGDAVVNEADTTNLYKNTDVDADGDGVVDKTNVADDTNNLNGQLPTWYANQDIGIELTVQSTVTQREKGSIYYTDTDELVIGNGSGNAVTTLTV